MTKKGIAILIIILLLIYALIVGVLFIFKNGNEELNNNSNNVIDNNEDEEKQYDYLEIDNTIQLKYFNGTWSLANDNDFNDVLFDIYVNQEYFGYYYLKKGVNWNIFDQNNNYIDYNGSLIAGTTGLQMKVRNSSITIVDSNDLQEASSILGVNIDMLSLSTNQKIIIDLDNNGIMDKVISLSNLYAEIEQPAYYNLVYVNLNGKIIILVNELIDIKDILISPSYKISYFINMFNNIYDSIFIQKGYFSNVGETTYLIYDYKNNTYSLSFDDN